MKVELNPLALNELLDRRLIVPFNAAPGFLSCTAQDLNVLVSQSVSNAELTGPEISGKRIQFPDNIQANSAPVE
jgi:hypothetical protein